MAKRKADMTTQFQALVQQERTGTQALDQAYKAAHVGDVDKAKELFEIAKSLGVDVPESINFSPEAVAKVVSGRPKTRGH